MHLSGKRVVLLGGTSGIGLATTKAVSAEGAQAVVASSRQSSVDHAIGPGVPVPPHSALFHLTLDGGAILI